MQMSTWLSEQEIKYYFTTASVGTRPAAWNVSLHTGNPGATGANEVTTGMDANYARKAVTFAAALNGNFWEAKNSGDVVMNAADASASYTATYVGIWDGAGNFLAGTALAAPSPVTAGTVVTFAINDIIIRGKTDA